MITGTTNPRQDGPYANWIKGVQPPPTRVGGHLGVIDNGPYEAARLCELFANLPLDVLSRCWVACVVDSLSAYKLDLGQTARALGVVSRRLHETPTVSEDRKEKPQEGSGHD